MTADIRAPKKCIQILDVYGNVGVPQIESKFSNFVGSSNTDKMTQLNALEIAIEFIRSRKLLSVIRFFYGKQR